MHSCAKGEGLPLVFIVSSQNAEATSCRHMELQSDATFVQDVTPSAAHTDDEIQRDSTNQQVSAPATRPAFFMDNFRIRAKLQQIHADSLTLIGWGGGGV